MIKSMTGFGKGRVKFGQDHIRVEVKTFNHKYFELSCKLPENLQIFEEKVKKIARKNIKRGKLYLWIMHEQCTQRNSDITIDEDKAAHYYRLLKKIKNQFDLKGEITLTQLLSFPEVIVYKPRMENKKLIWQATNLALGKAVNSLLKMRQKEGRLLYKDLVLRIKNIERSLLKIKTFIPQEMHRYKQKLKQKFNKSFDKNGTFAERIEAEVALFAKNCDVSEEMTRLHAHLNNFRSTLKAKQEAGKTLDFIAQEIQREINTLGAKSSDFKISKEVIFIKGEVEKIREQVQNIE